MDNSVEIRQLFVILGSDALASPFCTCLKIPTSFLIYDPICAMTRRGEGAI